MEEGLFPNRGTGWLLLLLIALAFFGVYYNDLYPKYYRALIDQYKQTGNKLICGEDLGVQLRYPKKVSQYTEQNLLVEVINDSDSFISFLGVSIEPNIHNYERISVSNVRSRYDLTRNDEGAPLLTYSVFHDIPPRSTTSSVYWMYVKTASTDTIILQMICFSEEKIIAETTLTLEYDPSSAIHHGLLEAVILPPWSNLFLLVISLVVVKLTEEHIPHITDGSGAPKSNFSLGVFIVRLVSFSLILVGYSLMAYGLLNTLVDNPFKLQSLSTVFWCGVGILCLGYFLSWIILIQCSYKDGEDNERADGQDIIETSESDSESLERTGIENMYNVNVEEIDKREERVDNEPEDIEGKELIDSELDNEYPSSEKLEEQTPDDSKGDNRPTLEATEPESGEQLFCPTCRTEVSSDDEICSCGHYLPGCRKSQFDRKTRENH